MHASVVRRQDNEQGTKSALSPKSKIQHLKKALRTIEKRCSSSIRGHKAQEPTTIAPMRSIMMMDTSLNVQDLKLPLSKDRVNNNPALHLVKDFDASSSTNITAEMSDSSMIDYEHSFTVFSPQGTALPFVEEETSSRRSSAIEITKLIEEASESDDTDNDDSFVRRSSPSMPTTPSHQQGPTPASRTSFAARRLAERLSSRYSATGTSLAISAKRQSLNIKPVKTNFADSGDEEPTRTQESSDPFVDEVVDLPVPTRISFQSRPTSIGSRATSRPAHAPAPLIDMYMSDSEEEGDNDDDEEEESDAPLSYSDCKAETKDESTEYLEDEPCNCSQEPTSLVCGTRSPPRSSSAAACHGGRHQCPRRKPPKRQSGVLCVRGINRNTLGDSLSSGCDLPSESSPNPRTPPTRQSGVLSRRRADKQTPFSTTRRRTPSNSNRTALPGEKATPPSSDTACKRELPARDRSSSASRNDQQVTLKSGKSIGSAPGRISRADRIRNSKQGAESLNGNHPKKDHCPFLIQRQVTVQQEDNNDLDKCKLSGNQHPKPRNKKDQMPCLVRRQMTKEPSSCQSGSPVPSAPSPVSLRKPVRSTPSPMSPRKTLSSPSGGILSRHRMDGSSSSSSSAQRSPKKTLSSGCGILPRFRVDRSRSSSLSPRSLQLGNGSSGEATAPPRRRLPSRQSGILSPTRALPAAGNSDRRLRSKSRSKSIKSRRESCRSRRESIQNLSLLVGSDNSSCCSSNSSIEDEHVDTKRRVQHNKRRNSVSNLTILLTGNHHQAGSSTIGAPQQLRRAQGVGRQSSARNLMLLMGGGDKSLHEVENDGPQEISLQRRESIRNMGLLLSSSPTTTRRSTVHFADPQSLLDIHDITMSDTQDDDDDDDSSSEDEYQTYQYLRRESAAQDATSLFLLNTMSTIRANPTAEPIIPRGMINNANVMADLDSEEELDASDDDDDDDDDDASLQSSSCALSIDSSASESTTTISSGNQSESDDADDFKLEDSKDGEEPDDWDNVVPPPPF